MSWSINTVSYRMAGSGSWQYLLADEESEKFYSSIYPSGIKLSKMNKTQKMLIATWQRADIIKIVDEKAIPIGPIMTDGDLMILKEWFEDQTLTMCDAIKTNLNDYQALAGKIAGNTDSAQYQNILTIMICAHTLDSMVFSHLRKTVMGSYIPRGSVGTFYFWGYGFSKGPKRIFGFTSYGGYGNAAIHVIRSHALDREKLKQVLQNRALAGFLNEKYIAPKFLGTSTADVSTFSPNDIKKMENLQATHLVDKRHPNQLAIPVFNGDNMRKSSELYFKASTHITTNFMKKMNDLGSLVKQCTFARCPSADVLCMLFHLAYSYAADALVEEGVVAEFPESATAEWGVWIH